VARFAFSIQYVSKLKTSTGSASEKFEIDHEGAGGAFW
jgi:hypothetical protein